MSSDDGAARAGPERPQSENHVAERVKMEREVRGWSTAKLAEAMAEVGHPVNQSAIWRIESGKPRRRVNFDEALGFCKVFDISVDDLYSPPGHIANAHIRGLVGKYVERWKAWFALGKEMDAIQAELKKYTDEHPDQEDVVKGLLAHELAAASDGAFDRHRGMGSRMRSWLGDKLPQASPE